jgi:hypothetical protein
VAVIPVYAGAPLMAHELRGVDSFIRDRLAADTTLWTLIGGRFYTRPAPGGTAAPYVIATFLSSVDRNALRAVRLYSQALYLVRVVTTDPNTTTADTIADRIDTALVQQLGTVAAQSIYIGIVQREEAIRYEEVSPSGVVHQHTGARYRFWVEPI